MNNEILTAKCITKLLRIHVNTLHRWVKNNKFPQPLNIGSGKIKRWSKDVVYKFIVKNCLD